MATNPFRLSRYVAPLLALVLLTGCADHAAQSELRLKRLLLLNLTYSNTHDLTYPNLSTPDTIKVDLSPLVIEKQKAEPDKGWDADIFIDDTSGQAFIPNANMAKIYAGKVDSPWSTIAAYAPQPHNGKRLVGYMDGHVTWVDELEWPAVKAKGLAP